MVKPSSKATWIPLKTDRAQLERRSDYDWLREVAAKLGIEFGRVGAMRKRD